MSTCLLSTIEKGSDMVQDFLCSTCEEKKLEESADYYCESCVKFYCRKCINFHGQLFTEHFPHGRGDMMKWPVAKKVEDFLLKCDIHKEENLAMFCKDHSQLCCRNCAIFNHRQCKTVMLLSDLVKNTSTDLKQASVTIQTTLAKLKDLQENQEASIQSVQSSFDEQLKKIQETRQKIIAALDILENKTLNEMKDTLTKLQASLKSDVDTSSTLRDELKQFGNAIQDIRDKGKQELSLIASIKYQDKIQLFEKYQKENFVSLKYSITFQPNSEIVQYLSKLSGLGRIEQGNPDQVISMDEKSEYNVHAPGEMNCSIRDICVLPSGQVLVLDITNNNVKLLNPQYQVVSHCSVGEPWGICKITPNEVGITVCLKKIQFIKVNNSMLVKGRKLQLQHQCMNMAYHKEDMFVTSGNALYEYTLSGTLVGKLHEDNSNTDTVWRCAVSPKGDKLYITNPSQHALLTLARDGSVLATFMDPEVHQIYGIHVTPSGQVLGCGCNSNMIIQLDSSGSRKLATLATKRDGLQGPFSVCYNSITGSIIVGQLDNIKILVFRARH